MRGRPPTPVELLLSLALDAVLVLVLAILLSALSVPGLFAVLGSVLLFLLLRILAGRPAFVLVCLSLAIGIGGFEIGLRLTKANPAYYRPDEVLSRFATDAGRSHYEPDRRLDFAMPYGDLFALSDRTAPEVVEPRQVVFVTDKLGYRNTSGPGAQAFVLIGDSFAAGSGTTQDQILGETLRRAHGIDVYSAAFPGGPIDYAQTLAWLKANTTLVHDRNVIALVFEGNDLTCATGTEPRRRSIAEWRWRPVTRLETYRLFYGLTRAAVGAADRGQSVAVHQVGGKAMGFLRFYIDATTQTEPCDWSAQAAALQSMAPHLALIAFAPTKYRVYADWIAPTAPMPNIRWAFVDAAARTMGVPALDLTPFLQSRAEALLPQGKYVYWRDDSHWNGDGIAAAAEAIATALKR